VNLAEGKSIWNYRIAPQLGITDDVRSVEQLSVPKAANCTSGAVSMEYLLAEYGLVESLTRHSRGVDLLRSAQIA